MPLSHSCAAAVVAIVWGLNFVALRLGLDDFPPLIVLALRYLLTFFPFVFFVRLPQKPLMVLLFAVFVGLLQFPLLMYALSIGASAGLGSLIMQTQVLFSVLFGAVIFKERIAPWTLVGLAFCAVGVVMLATVNDEYSSPLAVLLMVIGAACWAAGNVTSRAAGNVDTMSFVVWSSAIPPLPLIAVSLMVDGSDAVLSSIANIDLRSALLLMWLAYPATLAAWFTWVWLIKYNGVSKVAPMSLLVPLSGMVASAIVFGETFTLFKFVAMGFVLFGLALVVFLGQREKLPAG